MAEERARIIRMVRRYCSELAKKVHVEKAVLFGSWARDDYKKTSDVDLIVVSKDFERMPFLKRLEFLSLQWPFYKAADILGYTPKEYREFSKKSIVVREAHKDGLVVFPSH